MWCCNLLNEYFIHFNYVRGHQNNFKAVHHRNADSADGSRSQQSESPKSDKNISCSHENIVIYNILTKYSEWSCLTTKFEYMHAFDQTEPDAFWSCYLFTKNHTVTITNNWKFAWHQHDLPGIKLATRSVVIGSLRSINFNSFQANPNYNTRHNPPKNRMHACGKHWQGEHGY